MTYHIRVHKRVTKFFVKHPLIAKQAIKIFDIIANDPINVPANIDIVPLRGHPSNYRLRIGKYRILYEVKTEVITLRLWDANTRGDIYK